jgi:ATP-binding cassette, subfamily B, bacterial PglK
LKGYLQEVLHLLGDERRKLPVLILLFLGGSLLDLVGLSLIGPYITLVLNPLALTVRMEQIIEIIGLPREQKPLLIIMGVFLIWVFLLKSISAIWINYKIIRFSQSQQVRLRSLLMHTYQSMPYIEHLRRNSSEYIHSMQILASQFSIFVLFPGLRTLSDSCVVLVIFTFLAWNNWQALTLLVVLLGTLLIGYDRLFRRKIRDYGKNANAAATSMVKGIHEAIEGLKEIRILGSEAYFYEKVREDSIKHIKFTAKTDVISTAPRYLLEFVLISFVVLLVVTTLLMEKDMIILLPTLGMFGVAALRLLPSASVLSDSLIKIRFGRDAVSLLFNDLKELNIFTQKSHKKYTGTSKTTFSVLSLNKISYNYPGTVLSALNQISLTIHAGETIGLMGTSGSGKTTLVDLLLGLLTPSEGKLLYNGRILNEETTAQWRAQVAYLPQQVFLIDNTLCRNVALGVEDKDIDTKRVNEALRKSFLLDFVEQLPLGTETVLGERGVRLSGGQRQRVALARAFYHNKNILIMDESTSALDNETEKEIVEEIKNLKGQKTLIVIAHRLTTLIHCDRIYRLENGMIVEEGELTKIVSESKI